MKIAIITLLAASLAIAILIISKRGRDVRDLKRFTKMQDDTIGIQGCIIEELEAQVKLLIVKCDLLKELAEDA